MVDQPDSWGFSPNDVPPPTITLKVLLADLGNYAAYASYQSNLEAQAATNSRFMPMDDEGGGDGGDDPCTLTNLLQAFTVTTIARGANGATTITWQSCQFFRYLVFSASAMTTNMQWVPQAYVWGSNGASVTSWTDLSTTNNDGNTIAQKFYRVQRLLGMPIAAGGNSGLAITPDQRLWAWGSNGDGQLGDNMDPNNNAEFIRPYPEEAADPAICNGRAISNVLAVASGGDEFSVAVDASGVVWTCGDNDKGELGWGPVGTDESVPTALDGISTVVSVAAGAFHTLALRADMKVFAWGTDRDDFGRLSGQLGVGGLPSPYYTVSPTQSLTPASIVAIAAGSYHSVALDTNGMVWTWGEGDSGQLGNGGSTNFLTPSKVAGISNVIAIAAGAKHTLALTADKHVWAWGTNTMGQLGNGTTNGSATPVQVINLDNVVAIAGGTYFSLAVTSNGWVYGWGDNNAGQLATNRDNLSFTNAPMRMDGLSNAVLVSAPVSPCTEEFGCDQGKHSMAVTVDAGTNHYWGWGYNLNGEVGSATNANYVYTPQQSQFCTRCQRCVQLGTGGPSSVFTAQCNGTLYLYFNDDQTAFGDNDGSFTASVDGYAPVTVYANDSSGAAVGAVTNGGVYQYSASGYCTWNQFLFPTPELDPNGTDTNAVMDCSNPATINKTNAVCPTATCFSLVGRIQ